jgi:diaminopropionate ammonia-lyase
VLTLQPNTGASPRGNATPYLNVGLNRERRESTARKLAQLTDFAPTQLLPLNGLASSLGIGQVWLKDESSRCGLGSFKAVGGIVGVSTALEYANASGCERAARTRPVISCASDGNHGIAVAWAAREHGCPCVVFVPDACPPSKRASISALGATTIYVPGTYEEAHDKCIQECEANGWTLVSDTATRSYTEIPLAILSAYQCVIAEAYSQLSTSEQPTHVFVQAGTGGLAAAVAGYLTEELGRDRPQVVVVEAMTAACLLRSVAAGRAVTVAGPHETIMAGLACGAASSLAWPILQECADLFVAITDDHATSAMATLAGLHTGGALLGPSGVAGLAALLALGQNRLHRAEANLSTDSRVLLFGTEARYA